MATQLQVRDAMQFVNEQDPATRERFIERLELRSNDPTFVAYREAYLELIDLPRTATVLDLGCGTGVVARAIAARDGFTGTVTGIDLSDDFIAAAETFAADDGVSDRVQFAVGDAHQLDFRAASFDTVAHTLVSHVRDPLAVLAEAARVVRPGGYVAVFDGDYASLTFGCSDPRLGEAVEPALQATIMSSPRVMREIPRLLPKAGLRLIATQAHVYAEAGSSTFMLNLAETYAPLTAASAGQLSAAHVDAWLADQRRSASDGTFFAACNYYAYVARR
jgi:SAM-dependent methyltransferase